MSSGTACCYKGCVKSYSNDKDVAFFKFPDDQKRRKKWMENCGNTDLVNLNERQLRLKRICADHFAPVSFICPVTRTQLTEKAIPMTPKENEAAEKAREEAAKEGNQSGKRGRGRPARLSVSVGGKKEADEKSQREEEEEEEEEEDEEEEEEEEEEDEKEEEEGGDGEEGGYPNENGDIEYSPPPHLKRQTRESNGATESKSKGGMKAPRLVAVNSDTSKPKQKAPGQQTSKQPSRTSESERRMSSGGRKMADLSVIDDVVREIVNSEKAKKRQMEVEKAGGGKRSKAEIEGEDDDEEEGGSEDEDSVLEESEEESEEGMEKANREFEMFQAGLRKIISLPPRWGMGSVVWDPLNKIKVIPIVEPVLHANGHIVLYKSIQIFEDSTVKVVVDGVDLTLNFGIQSIQAEEDVNKIIKAVADSRVCQGVQNFHPDDIIYLPEARKRGYKYFSDACPVVLDENSKGDVCNPCIALQKAVITRKQKEKEDLANRKLRPVPKNIKNKFGRSMYGLLNEILEDADALKSEDEELKKAVLAKYSTELGVMNGEIQKPEKIPHIQVNVEEVSASFREIVTRLGFNLNKKPGPGGAPNETPQPVVPRPKPRVEENRPPFANKPFLSKFSRPSVNVRTGSSILSRPTITTSVPVSVASNATSFSLGDGQTFEILGEVGSAEGGDTKGIEIIEVDEETMAKLTSQNSNVVFQNNTSSGNIQVTTLDSSDPNMTQILKAISPTQA